MAAFLTVTAVSSPKWTAFAMLALGRSGSILPKHTYAGRIGKIVQLGSGGCIGWRTRRLLVAGAISETPWHRRGNWGCALNRRSSDDVPEDANKRKRESRRNTR